MALTDPKKRSLGSGPSASAAPGAGMSAPAAGGAAPAPAAPQKQGTGFVNLSDILAANRAGAQQMGNQLTSQVEGQGSQAHAGIVTGKNAFNNAVTAGTPRFNPATSTNRESMTTGRTTGYTGPKTWEEAGVNTATLTEQAAKAQDAAKALSSQGGRAALLRQQNPGLTAGGASMDAFLAGAGGGQRLQDVSAKYANLSDMLAGFRGEATGAVSKAEEDAASAQQQYGAMQDAGWAATQTPPQDVALDRAESEDERRRRRLRNGPRDRLGDRGEVP